MATFPTSPGIRSCIPRYRKARSRSVSEFTFQAQTYLFSGERWEFEITFPSMSATDAATVISFLHTMCSTGDTTSKDMSAYLPSSVTGTRTLRLVDPQVEWSVDEMKRFGVTFTLEDAV
jgi:hypothetical protein